MSTIPTLSQLEPEKSGFHKPNLAATRTKARILRIEAKIMRAQANLMCYQTQITYAKSRNLCAVTLEWVAKQYPDLAGCN